MIEKAVPMIEGNEPDFLQGIILEEKKELRKGGGAEKTESVITEIPAHADTKQLENKPAQNKERDQPVQAR